MGDSLTLTLEKLHSVSLPHTPTQRQVAEKNLKEGEKREEENEERIKDL